MNRWQKLRNELLREIYDEYMKSYTAWLTFEGTDEFSKRDVDREIAYLEEKGFVRISSGSCQLTAHGRDYVETNLLDPAPPKAQRS